jgi:hypothetical protein
MFMCLCLSAFMIFVWFVYLCFPMFSMLFYHAELSRFAKRFVGGRPTVGGAAAGTALARQSKTARPPPRGAATGAPRGGRAALRFCVHSGFHVASPG